MKKPQKWIAPKRPGIPSDILPDPDWVVVRQRVVKAGLADDADAVVGFVRDVTADYIRAKTRDEAVAWSGQVVGLADRVRIAARSLQLADTEWTILRATTISPFAFDDALDLLTRLAGQLDDLAAAKGPPIQGGARAVGHARQVSLAQRFWGAFTSNGWPTQTSPNSLMPQLVKIVLNAAGEKRATIKRLLEETRPNS